MGFSIHSCCMCNLASMHCISFFHFFNINVFSTNFRICNLYRLLSNRTYKSVPGHSSYSFHTQTVPAILFFIALLYFFIFIQLIIRNFSSVKDSNQKHNSDNRYTYQYFLLPCNLEISEVKNFYACVLLIAFTLQTDSVEHRQEHYNQDRYISEPHIREYLRKILSGICVYIGCILYLLIVVI